MADKGKRSGNPEPAGTTGTSGVDKIVVRMYRPGTGDFFLLLFKTGEKVTYKMLIDCGCINAGKDTFTPYLEDLKKTTGGKIDVLVVTHEHADHINGFKIASDYFRDNIKFKKVWFAWTESKDDPVAGKYRKTNMAVKSAIAGVANKMNGLVKDKYYEKQFRGSSNEKLMTNAQHHFIASLTELHELNTLSAAGNNNTMEDFLKENNVIDKSTEVNFYHPGETISGEPGAKGIRFYILGPPKDPVYLGKEEKTDDTYQKREKPGSIDFAFINAFAAEGDLESPVLPFKSTYELTDTRDPLIRKYKEHNWRSIDNDWMYAAGSIALRFEKSINNTSLVFAIQFEESERILLFPGDAEYGNWASWHDGLTWDINKGGKKKKVNARYILKNVVFYKVGHHLSQNGTAKSMGFELMLNPDMAAMASLDYKKISKVWLNTMPNDELGASLLKRTKGKFFFAGDTSVILDNIKTDRVSVFPKDEKECRKMNGAFSDSPFIDYEVTG